MKKIPQLVHLYWDGSPMSYLHMMTVKSLHKLNPNVKILIHTPLHPSGFIVSWNSGEQEGAYTGKDYWPETKSLPYIEINEVDFNNFGLPSDISEVYKSDFIRLVMISAMGGIWSDFDILYIKPLSCLNPIAENPENLDVVVTFDKHGHYIIGFFMASPMNRFFGYMFNVAKEIFSDRGGYQVIGNHMFMRTFPTLESAKRAFPYLQFGNLPVHSLYPINYGVLNQAFTKEGSKEGEAKLKSDTIGIHWYYGNDDTKEFCNTYSPNNIIECLLTKIIKQLDL